MSHYSSTSPPSLAPTAATSSQGQVSPPPREGHSSSAPRVRRRNRVIASCLECRRRKLKCDKQQACSNCVKFNRDCLYLAPALDSASQQRLTALKDRMGSLENFLQESATRTDNQIKLEDTSDAEEAPEIEDERLLEATPLAVFDQVYDDGPDDDLMDLGVQFGKMRVADRIGGFARPMFANELGHYERESNQTSTSPGLGPGQQMSAVQNWLQTKTPAEYLTPGPDYLAPSSTFPFPASSGNVPLSDYLPSKSFCDTLMTHYWARVHTVTMLLHKPSFQKQYQLFWEHVKQGTEPPYSLQSVMFAAMFAALVAIPAGVMMQQYGMDKTTFVPQFQSTTEMLLSRANVLRTTKLETLQAFVIYLVPLCRAEISRAHSVLVGTAIRLAECMGLHRDGSFYGFSAVEVHIRRLIWHELHYLDIRTCEAVGPKPQIRPDEYDTKFPANVNEQDLTNASAQVADAPYFTDCTVVRIRAECTGALSQIWQDISKIDQKKLKIAVVLAKIQKFKREMEAKWLPMLKGTDLRQVLAVHIYRIISSRLVIMLLHRYTDSAGSAGMMPDRLNNLLLEASLAVVEFAISLETRPETANWAWYRGSLHQYHSTLLQCVQVLKYPNCAEAVRIWRCLDYVFEIPPSLTSDQKISCIIGVLKDRLGVYQSMRKARVSKAMENDYAVLSRKWQAQADREARDANMGLPSPPVAEASQGMTFQEFGMPPVRGDMSDSGGSQHSGPIYSGTAQLANNYQMPPQPLQRQPQQRQQTANIDWVR
ncbi:hypothetical protein MBLNU457_g2818t2 [Dothideomycetes sp. NU457]